VGSNLDGAAIVVEELVAGADGVYATVNEIDGQGGMRSHVVVLDE